MPHTVEELVEILDLEAIEDNLFRGRQPNTTRQRVFGGQVAAQALVAATRTVTGAFPEARPVHSLHSYFLRPGDPSVPIVYDVDLLRDGRSFATRRVLARQHGHPIFAMTASYQRVEDGFDHANPMPDVPGPDECPPLAEALGSPDRDSAEWQYEWGALDARFAGLVTERSGGQERVTGSRLWIRIDGELSEELQTPAFTYATDLTLLAAALHPHGIDITSPRLQPASLDHTVWFHRPFRADRWWLYDQASPSASGGRGLAMAEVFTADGVLGATVAQEGLIRLRRDA